MTFPATAAALCSLLGCSGPTSQYCATAAECDEEISLFGFNTEIPVDGVGNSDDSAGVCAAEVDGYLASLRANSEDVCHELAAAYDSFMSCAVEEGDCDAWTSNDCEDEREDIEQLWDEAEGRCAE